MDNLIYVVGLIMAIAYMAFGIDDIIWDALNLISKHLRKTPSRLAIEDLDNKPPKLLAIMVAAWHEDSVIEPVIDNLIESVQYPRSMYHVFLGVYPNDYPTINAAERLANKYENVHVIINSRPGPTCKADNINNMIRNIKDLEKQLSWRFASVTVHDSEDVVHPYELKVTNYLIDDYDSLQFPVFPLQRMPSLENFFSGMTSGTYADEFADNHFRTMEIRDRINAIVPSAGTGFVISHKILDDYGNEDLFPEDSLTEDYKLSLTFAERGYRVHYVLEKVQRIVSDGKIKWDYIATRSIFPATFKTAVRQKTRWIYGITMQSAKFRNIFKASKLSLVGRYTLYKDLKAKITNLLTLPGYAIMIYAILCLFLDIPIMYPMYSVSWWICVAIVPMTLFRQILRAIAIGNVYGTRSVVAACLVPPLLPMRLVWGNVINLCATIGAWRQLIFGIKTRKTSKKVVWNKTDHEFLGKHILYRFYRNVGDVLLEKKYISAEKLKFMLRMAKKSNKRLGDVLLEHSVVTEDKLMAAVANSRHSIFVKDLEAYDTTILKHFDRRMLTKASFAPILKVKEHYVYAVTNFTPEYILDKIKKDKDNIVYTTKRSLDSYLISIKYGDNKFDSIIYTLDKGQISWEQAVIAIENMKYTGDIMKYIGNDWNTTYEYERIASLIS